uniref:HAT C-terminal dimerisation domain-containing protein n=1 Tax=Nothobranchius furzeri TaxID=105023 RepID=A0A8C6NWX5_NOTFU
MLQRLVEQCRAVQIMTQESNMGRTPTVIYPNEWGLASDMLTLLSPFEEVTRALSKHSASISEVIPLLHEGQDQDGAAESRETLGAAARKLADNLSKELQWRFEPIFANTTLLHATLLDPRYKASCFPNSVDVAAPARITEETPNYNGVSNPSLQTQHFCTPLSLTPDIRPAVSQTTPATSSTSVLSFLHKKKSATPMRTHLPTGDVEAYLADGDISLSDDPVKYWSGKLQFWPKLTHFALQHLCCPPTSVQSESVFSTTGNVPFNTTHDAQITYKNHYSHLPPHMIPSLPTKITTAIFNDTSLLSPQSTKTILRHT